MSDKQSLDLSEFLVEVNVSNLASSGLDYALAKALGKPVLVSKYYDRFDVYVHPEMPHSLGYAYMAHFRWETFGPLVGQFKMEFKHSSDGAYTAKAFKGQQSAEGSGENHFIAGCRAILHLLTGEKALIPKQLLETM